MNFAGWPNCFRREITFEGGGSPECQGAWFLDVESPDPSWHGRELGLGPGGAAGADAPAPLASGLSVFGKISAKFRQNFARFRLYQNQILQVNTRLTAFFKIY